MRPEQSRRQQPAPATEAMESVEKIASSPKRPPSKPSQRQRLPQETTITPAAEKTTLASSSSGCNGGSGGCGGEWVLLSLSVESGTQVNSRHRMIDSRRSKILLEFISCNAMCHGYMF